MTLEFNQYPGKSPSYFGAVMSPGADTITDREISASALGYEVELPKNQPTERTAEDSPSEAGMARGGGIFAQPPNAFLLFYFAHLVLFSFRCS